jgi:hypothetical protein
MRKISSEKFHCSNHKRDIFLLELFQLDRRLQTCAMLRRQQSVWAMPSDAFTHVSGTFLKTFHKQAKGIGAL